MPDLLAPTPRIDAFLLDSQALQLQRTDVLPRRYLPRELNIERGVRPQLFSRLVRIANPQRFDGCCLACFHHI